jgi:hypothetical protein
LSVRPPLFIAFLSFVIAYILTSALPRLSGLFYFIFLSDFLLIYLPLFSSYVFLCSPPHHTGLRTRHGTRAIITGSQHTVTTRLRHSGVSETTAGPWSWSKAATGELPSASQPPQHTRNRAQPTRLSRQSGTGRQHCRDYRERC